MKAEQGVKDGNSHILLGENDDSEYEQIGELPIGPQIIFVKKSRLIAIPDAELASMRREIAYMRADRDQNRKAIMFSGLFASLATVVAVLADSPGSFDATWFMLGATCLSAIIFSWNLLSRRLSPKNQLDK